MLAGHRNALFRWFGGNAMIQQPTVHIIADCRSAARISEDRQIQQGDDCIFSNNIMSWESWRGALSTNIHHQ